MKSGRRHYRVAREGAHIVRANAADGEADEVLVYAANPWRAIDAAVKRWYGKRAVWTALNAHTNSIDERGRFSERGRVYLDVTVNAEWFEARLIVHQLVGEMPTYDGVYDLRPIFAAQEAARSRESAKQ